MKYKQKLLATLVAMVVSSSVFAQNAVLENEYIKAYLTYSIIGAEQH